MKRSTTQSKTIMDPVCHMRVDFEKTHLAVTYQGRGYYFCAEACRKAFERNPERFLGSRTAERKGWWDRYLERLAKAQERGLVSLGPQCH